MYVQKKLMAKLEQERIAADLANVQQKQMDALKTFASLQQINSAQQQKKLTAFLAAAMMNKNFILNQQQQQLNAPVLLANNKVNQSTTAAKSKSNQVSRKRSHSEIDAFSSSEEEPYLSAKLRQPPSLGKINSSSSFKPAINLDTKVDQNNNTNNSFKEKTVSTTNLNNKVKQYDSNHSDEEELEGKKNKRGRNYRKMMIEKRRRDRINNSLNELRRLVPAAFEKQGSAKLEKAEILQMTVDHLKSLHSKGFDTFSFEPNKFALDYHTIGYNECVNEVVKYLATNEDIDELVKQRVISHLKGYSYELKDGNNNGKLLMNLNDSINLNNKINSITPNKKGHYLTGNNPTKQETNLLIKQEKLSYNQHQNQHNINNNLNSLTNLNSTNILPPSPPNSDTLSSTSSSYAATSTSPNSSSESDQIYIPYALLKSKKLSYNSTSVKQTNEINSHLRNYKPNQSTLTNFNLNTLKQENSSNETKFIVDQVCRPWNQRLKCL